MDLHIDRSTLAKLPDRLHAGAAAVPVTEDVAYQRIAIVNVFFAGAPDAGDRGWVLVDAGLRGSAARIRQAAEARYGEGARPSAIVLTHGHFDHVGALATLAEEWDCPIYAHELELPFITGVSAYPPPDPTVGGGAMARMAYLYPRGPYDFGERVRTLPADGQVPGLPGWRWVHTPGHTPGHVSLFRDSDRLLIAGDAVVTTRQESMMAVATQREEINGPPMYYTPDWESAHESVRRIAELNVEILATGHGRPLRGGAVRDAIGLLAEGFRQLAVPAQGRYVNEPARFAANGVVSIPPAPVDRFPAMVLATGIAVLGIIALGSAVRRRNEQRIADQMAYDADFEQGIELEAALMAGDDELGSAHEDEQHVPVGLRDGHSHASPELEADVLSHRYGHQYGARHSIQYEGEDDRARSEQHDVLGDRARPSGP